MFKALKWKLICYAPLIVSVVMLGLALAGIAAAENYRPYLQPRYQ